jgi:hypothetical protein
MADSLSVNSIGPYSGDTVSINGDVSISGAVSGADAPSLAGHLTRKDYVDALVAAYSSRGLTTGGLKYNDATTPPYLKAGAYEINGTMKVLTADAAFAVTDILGDKALRANYWYLVMMDSSGNKAIQLETGINIGKTYAITSISGTNTLNFAGSAGGTQPVAGMIAVVTGIDASGEVGLYPIASVGGGATVTSIVISGTLSNQAGAGGTVVAYYRISSHHQSGVSITTAANTFIYSPLQYSSPQTAAAGSMELADFSPALNGYYSKFTGYTTYRIIGCFYSDGTPNISTLISYGLGANKCDDELQADTFAAYATTVETMIAPFTNYNRLWGNNYTLFQKTGTNNADKITINESLRVFMAFTQEGAAATAQGVGISLNSAQLTTAVQSCTRSTILALAYTPAFAAGQASCLTASVNGYRCKKTDVLRCHVSGGVPVTAAVQSLSFSGRID